MERIPSPRRVTRATMMRSWPSSGMYYYIIGYFALFLWQKVLNNELSGFFYRQNVISLITLHGIYIVLYKLKTGKQRTCISPVPDLYFNHNLPAFYPDILMYVYRHYLCIRSVVGFLLVINSRTVRC